MFVKIISGIGIVAFLAIAALLLASSFSIPGVHLNARVVETGSMEPTISTGSVVFVSPAEHYTEGDIITFKRASDDADMPPVTHRIIAVRADAGEYRYVTKGDANGVEDTKDVKPEEIIGAVRFHIPWLGYALRAARTPLGFVALIVLPLGLIIADEVKKIVREVRRKKVAAGETGDPVVPPPA